ncbi:MAG: glycosyltransferase [Hyphomonadaceae bacterium]|nr:MAG: glycosyl transferase family protein [Caulobacteraceae bacterium]MBT9446793.1 glycosyltransferase [Hyphomonadaceae bacterium]TPW06346.1 MAG: glycosyl transferase family protein [Alphaproteobacteria bacterium]
MRVLHVMAGADAGGAETMMLDGVLALADAGVEQHVVTRDSANRLAAIRAADVPVDEASFDKFWRFPTQATIDNAIRTFNPHVIHYWMGRAGMFAPAKWREKSLGWYGGYYKLSRFRNCAWQAGVTGDIARHIVDQGAPADRVSTLHTFAAIEPAEPASRASLDTPADAPVVLALARLHWKKGIDTLLDAVAQLPGVYAWIAGSGPLEAELKQRAETLGISERVRFLGWRTDRAALLGACDIVAFPSRYEPFGTVTVEAWAAGKPLVVADAAGPAATVTNEVNALLVPKDNVDALRDALKRVMEDAELAHTLVANGKRAYEAGFTKQAFVRAAMALYERIKGGSTQ